MRKMPSEVQGWASFSPCTVTSTILLVFAQFKSGLNLEVLHQKHTF